MGRMVITLALLAGLAVTAHGQPAGEKPDKECCDTKTVGGVTYSLIGQMDTKMYNCLSDCIYMKEGQEGGKFCFAMGDLQVECNDEEMEGSEKPPMEGSEKPPMGGSETPVALPAGLPLTAHGQPAGEKPDKECCDTKTVGGMTYSLIGQMDTKMFGDVCLSDCIYMREGQEGSKFCFAMGDLPVECNDEEMESSEKPPIEGSEKPPMEGSEKPPLEEGSSRAPGATTTAAGCKCGKKRTSRIVGGSETEINEYPWMAAVSTTQESQFCGGSLIASQWVITATHCMFKDQAQTIPQTAEEIVVVLGEHDLLDANESKLPKKVVKVSMIIKHESYDKQTSNNDIALLKLAEEVDLNTYTPACLPKTADNYEGKNAWVYGWGTIEYGGQSATKLLEVEVPVVSNSVCQAAMPQYQITEAMLCAGGQLNKDGCQGDSGGPLTVDDNGKHVLIGDVSFGNQCGLEDQYGVYGDVAYFRTWVDTNVANNGGAKYCPA